MATLDRKLPNSDAFLCKSWSTYTDAAKLYCSDNARVEDFRKEWMNGREAMQVNKGDIQIFGQCPARDDFYHVVCNICSQVVKPQGLLTHFERRHGPLVPPRDSPHSPFSRAPRVVYPPKASRGRPCVSVPVVSLTKMPCLGRAAGAHARPNCTSSSSSSSSLSPAARGKPPERVPNGRAPAAPPAQTDRRPAVPPSSLDRWPSPSPSLTDRRPAPSPSTTDRGPFAPPSPLSALERKPQNGTKASRPYMRLSGRVFDPNKHCGVLDPESKRPCTRSLTCKTHSLTHRRAVSGRRKLFDTLLAEHKGQVKEKDGGRKREPQGGKETLSHSPANGLLTKTSALKTRLAIMSTCPRPLGGGGSAGLSTCSGPTPDSAPLGPRAERVGRPSSDESEGDAPEEAERPACHHSQRHPWPLGQCCAFGSRLMGRGCYVFDRRLSRLRLALHSMVERHVNLQMWKKVPLVGENPLFPSPVYLSYTEPPPLLSPPAFATPSDSISMVTYSTALPHSDRGVLGILDCASFLPPTAPVEAQAKPSKAQRAREQAPGATGKKRKAPLSATSSSCGSSPRGNGEGAVPLLSGSALSSNGTRPYLCAKPELPGRASPGLSNPVGLVTAADTPPAGTSWAPQSLLSLAGLERRRRKSPNTYGTPCQTNKTPVLNVYRTPSQTTQTPALNTYGTPCQTTQTPALNVYRTPCQTTQTSPLNVYGTPCQTIQTPPLNVYGTPCQTTQTPPLNSACRKGSPSLQSVGSKSPRPALPWQRGLM